MRLRQRLDLLHAHPQFSTARKIVTALSEQGYLTVFAGGCVRDSLLGVKPKDLDIATAASPEVVERSFPRTLAVGKSFGTIVVVESDHNFEVTTFRKDGPYLDGRHPAHVQFSDIAEDAKRRDFTINALFYDTERAEVLDFVGGVEDLRVGRLRTVGDAVQRFREDHLRILRAARFVAQLGFELDQDTRRAMRELQATLVQVSAERVFNEMKRLLISPYLVSGVKVLQEEKLAATVWPEIIGADLERLHAFIPFIDWENAFAAVMWLAGHLEQVEVRLRAWKAPRESLRRVEQQLTGLRTLLNSASHRSDRALVLGSEVFAEVLTLARGSMPGREAVIQGWIDEFLSITGPEGRLPKPWLTGQDLIANGIVPGERMGELLKALYAEQLQGGLASKEEALAFLRQIKA
jgi:tRNA nucleotidyltransferase (CCA-adding enzyme)